MDNTSKSMAGPSNLDVKNEPIFGDYEEINYPRSASVSTCDLNSILDHLKAEPLIETDVIRNLVSFVEPSSVDKCPHIKQEKNENDPIDIKEELIADEEVDLKDLNLESSRQLHSWLKVENYDSVESQEILGPAPDLQFQQKDFTAEHTGEPSIKIERNTNEDRSLTVEFSQKQDFKKRHTAESSRKKEERADQGTLSQTNLLESLLVSGGSKPKASPNMLCRDGTGRTHSTKRNLITKDSFSGVSIDSAKCEFCGEHFLTSKHLKQHCLTHKGKDENKQGHVNNKKPLTEIDMSEEGNPHASDLDNDSCNGDMETSSNNKTVSALKRKDGSKSTNIHTGHIFCKCLDCVKDFKIFKSTQNSSKQKTKVSKTKYRPMCKICKKTFHRNRALTRHIENVHKQNKTVCKICCKALHSEYFETHMRTQHTDSPVVKKVFSCSKCDKNFKVKNNLQNHELKYHNNATKVLGLSFPCDVCKKSFSSKKNLHHHKKHIHSVDKETFICAHCDARFIQKTNIRVHIKLMHLPPTIKCTMCNLLFHNTVVLNKHLLVQHSIEKNIHKKSFICELCGKTFNVKYRYVYHMKTSHSNEGKGFKCQYCEKSFFMKHLLQQHSVVHSEARRFNCGLCDKGFKLKHHLRQHMAVHGLESTPDYRKKH